MAGISKRFGAVQANRDVDLTVAAGTAHGIVGENGAGKSTLMSILYGFYQADSGQISIDGRPVQITGSAQAIALGIGMVHQHFMLVEPLTRWTTSCSAPSRTGCWARPAPRCAGSWTR
jgi:general nucleoside transport system ATP-binding protein